MAETTGLMTGCDTSRNRLMCRASSENSGHHQEKAIHRQEDTSTKKTHHARTCPRAEYENGPMRVLSKEPSVRWPLMTRFKLYFHDLSFLGTCFKFIVMQAKAARLSQSFRNFSTDLIRKVLACPTIQTNINPRHSI